MRQNRWQSSGPGRDNNRCEKANEFLNIINAVPVSEVFNQKEALQCSFLKETRQSQQCFLNILPGYLPVFEY